MIRQSKQDWGDCSVCSLALPNQRPLFSPFEDSDKLSKQDSEQFIRHVVTLPLSVCLYLFCLFWSGYTGDIADSAAVYLLLWTQNWQSLCTDLVPSKECAFSHTCCTVKDGLSQWSVEHLFFPFGLPKGTVAQSVSLSATTIISSSRFCG